MNSHLQRNTLIIYHPGYIHVHKIVYILDFNRKISPLARADENFISYFENNSLIIDIFLEQAKNTADFLPGPGLIYQISQPG